MFVGYEQVAVGAGVGFFTALTVPNGTVRVQLQATGNSIRYTMSNQTPTAAVGMLLINGLAPEWFELEDLQRIRFVSAAGNALLNVHYYAPSPLSL